MAIDFPTATTVGQTYTDPTSGNTYVVTVVGPPAQWVGSGSSTNLDSTYLRKDASNDPVTGTLTVAPATNVEGLLVTQPSGNSAAAMRITNEGTGNSLLVEDSASTDSTPFVIQNDGTTLIGANTAVGTSKLQVTGGIQTTALNDGPLAGTRNRIINGGMAVDQRNAGAAQTITAAAALAYCVDRFYSYCTGANVTGQRVQGASVGQFRYQFTGAASVTGIGFGQRIEQLNSADLAGGTATLSVDLANSLLTSVTWTAYYANTADTFGTLASPTRTQIATGTFTVNSTVTNYSASINIPAAATTGIEIVFAVGAQTSGTWTIGNVQLERGTVATPFERRSFGQELALCQRYYWQSIDNYLYFGGYQAATGDLTFIVPLPMTMRASPTVVRLGSWTVTNLNELAPRVSPSNFVVTLRANNTGPAYLAAQATGIFTASAEL